jgi:hypothetical protein
MSGPKPLASIAFRDLYNAIGKLRAASEGAQQEQVLSNLIAGLRQCEAQWGIKRLPNGQIDTRRPIKLSDTDA